MERPIDNQGLNIVPILDKQLDELKASSSSRVKFGEFCPKCLCGNLDYDGILNLVCQNCGNVVTGSFT